MDEDEETERRAELNRRIVALLEEFSDITTFEEGLPVLGDWALVVAYENLGDQSDGNCFTFYPPQQWRYRTAGLLQTTADRLRNIRIDE